MSQYTVVMRDVAERRHEISTKAAVSTEQRPFHQLYSGNERLPVIHVGQAVPVYRMENYRTQTAQSEYVRKHARLPGFFLTGTEDVDAQQAQHDILYSMFSAGRGDSILAITTALKSDRRQTDPLLITRDGVVVNGNRRLAAMRELLALDPVEFEAFATVEAMVLPEGISQDEVRRIEVKLQMQPQTQLPYDWMNAALAVRDLRARDIALAEIRALMRLERDSHVTDMIERLGEAECYLEEYIGKPKEYEQIDAGHEQLFGDLQLAVRQKRTAGDKESARRIGHVIAKNSHSFGSRAYELNPTFGRRMYEVLDRLAQRRDIELNEGGAAADDVFGGDTTPDPYRTVREVLKDPAESESLATDIKEIYDELREEDREQDAAKKALHSARKANSALHEISFAQADPSTFIAIRAQLVSAHARAEALLHELATRLADE